jgi:rod shape-determining protein MreC
MRNSRRGRLVLTILLLAAFTLITVDYRSGTLNGVRNVASDVFGPIEDGVDHVTHPIGSWFSSIGHLGSYKHENQELKNQIAALQAQQHLSALQLAELAQYRKIYHLASLAQFRVVAAQVIAVGGGLGTDQTATINRGSVNGIRKNQTVINGNGLVGRTIVVGRTTSTILLGDDRTFAVGARLEGKQLELGLVQGGGLNQPMSLTLYNNSTTLTVGEDLVTAGDPLNNDQPFVPEVPIGHITKFVPPNGSLSETATVEPFVDFSSIDIVAVVIHAPPTIKHDSLLPAPPTPQPTVTVTVTTTPGSPSPGNSTPASGGTGSPGNTPDSSGSRSPGP